MPEINSEIGTGDSMEISFTVMGKIVPKQSTRFGQYGAYPSTKVKKYAEEIKRSYWAKYPLSKMVWEDRTVPLEIIINVYFEVPKSDSKKNRLWKLLHGFPTKVPDVDNCTKSILDGIKGVIFPDDAQIVSQTTNKLWSEDSRVEITIREKVRNE